MVRTMSKMTKTAEPTPFHHLLASLADEGRLLRLYTQNVDGIDTSMEPLKTSVPLNRKGPWPRTVQLHGGLQKMVCSKCHEMSELDADLFDGPVPPTCNMCEAADNARTEHAGKRSHGIGRLRPRMVLYNEYNPDEEAIGRVVAADLRTRPDALIVVGTTLKIPGVKRIVKEMCGVVRGRRGGLTVWINKDGPPPGKDYGWDLVVRGPCDRVAEHADIPRWDAPRPCVLIPATPKKDPAVPEALPTPRSIPAASRPASPTKDAASQPTKAVPLKLNLGNNPKTEAKRKPGRPPKNPALGGVRKRAPKKPKKDVPGASRISFTTSKAAATEGKKLAKITKDVEGTKGAVTDIKIERQPASTESPLSPRSTKPMHPVSPADLNATALPATAPGKDDAAGSEFAKAASSSLSSKVRRVLSVGELCS